MYFNGLCNEKQRSETKQQHFLQLFGSLFFKRQKNESQENIKNKWDIECLVCYTHHNSTKSTVEISLTIEVL